MKPTLDSFHYTHNLCHLCPSQCKLAFRPLGIMSIKAVKGYNSGRICVSDMFGEYDEFLVCPLFISCHERLPETKPSSFAVLLLVYKPLYWHLGPPSHCSTGAHTYLPQHPTEHHKLLCPPPSPVPLPLLFLFLIAFISLLYAIHIMCLLCVLFTVCLFFENISSMRAKIFFSFIYHYIPSTLNSALCTIGT